MYKVLIADDEAIIRGGLARFVESDPEFRVVATAEDGRAALAMAREHRPDLALVDINMPFINGLALTEQLLALEPDMVIVIISGYDDFTYAQNALRLGVMDYVLKPVMEDDFFDLLRRVKTRLAETRGRQRYLSWARDQMERYKPSLVDHFFQKWSARQLDALEVEEQLRYLGIDIPQQYEIMAIDLRDDYEQQSDGQPEEVWDENLLYYACQNIVEELYSAQTQPLSFRDQKGIMMVLSAQLANDRAQQLMQNIRETVERYLPVKVTMARASGSGVSRVPDVIDKAMAALEDQIQYSNVVTNALQYVDRNLSNPELSLQMAANALFISPQHLSRVFKHETGDTFGTFLAQARIRRAMALLRQPKLKMYEVSSRCGYSSQYYFSSTFKKALGLSPNEYRKNILGYGGEKSEKE